MSTCYWFTQAMSKTVSILARLLDIRPLFFVFSCFPNVMSNSETSKTDTSGGLDRQFGVNQDGEWLMKFAFSVGKHCC